jgi:hypothetical protein
MRREIRELKRGLLLLLHNLPMDADKRIELISEKIKRAKKHLGDFEVARNRFFDPQPYVIDREHNSQTGDDVFKVNNIRIPPVELALIAGDAIHNLRSALDHLTYQLVLVAGGKTSVRTGYPIFATAERYESEKARKVEGMSDAAKHDIDASKPYGGGTDELYWLHTLNISDKHHELLITLVSVSGALVIMPRWYKPRFQFYNFRTPVKDGDIILTCEPGFDENVNFAFDVAFGEPEVVKGKPVLELLHQTTDFVDNLIVSFRPHLE